MLDPEAVAIGALGALCLWYGLPIPFKHWGIRRLRRRCGRERMIALSFDDGPSERLTMKLLDLLTEHDAKATFFPLGFRVGANQIIIREILRRGHEVGCHSQHHLHPWKAWPPAVARDYRDGLSTLERAGCRSWLFRPPYGKLTLALLLQSLLFGHRLAWWTIDSTDTHVRTGSAESILQQLERHQGGVVLLHDHARPDAPDREEFVLQITRKILIEAAEHGYRFVAMGELLRDKA